MFYLFNASLDPKYRINILNTLNLPPMFSNFYRYTQSESRKFLSPEALAEIKRIKYKWKLVNIVYTKVIFYLLYLRLNTKYISKIFSFFRPYDGAIIFINRYASNGYEYYPIRLLYVLNIEEYGDKVLVHCVLTDYIFPNDTKKFNIDLVNVLGQQGLAKLTNSIPENKNDGYYLLHSRNNVFENAMEFQKGENVWDTIVEKLSQMPAFVNDISQYLFTKTRLRKGSNNNNYKSIILDRFDTYYRLKHGTEYTLNLKCNFYNTKPQYNDLQIELIYPQSIHSVSEPYFKIDNNSDVKLKHFSTKKHNEIKKASISLSSKNNNLLFVDNPIKIKISYNKYISFFLLAVIISLTFLTGSLSDFDFDKIDGPFKLLDFENYIWNKGWVKGFISIFQTTITLIALYIFGKKIL